MSNRILLSITLLGAAACAGDTGSDPSPTDDPGQVVNPNASDQPAGLPQPAEPEGIVLGQMRTVCASDGPCSPACVGGMVIDIHVPEGNCVTFDCSSVGGPTNVGGCHP
ncbi:hypothetical protein BH11MYX3_BH11MYX3_28590 [soil metagenome]